MNDVMTDDAYAVLDDDRVLKIQRRLPGPIDRVWAYLTDGEKRRKWLASGDMDLTPGAGFTFTWRNDELSARPGTRPPGADEEHSMDSRILEVDPPHKLSFTWGESAEVTFLLDEVGSGVVLTVIHRGVTERGTLLSVSAGWHSHLDVLAAITTDTEAEPFWDKFVRLKAEYETRIPE